MTDEGGLNPAPGDEAAELVHWLVMHPDGGKGAAATLAKKADVAGHTIGNYLKGKFPGRDSPAVRKLERFAQSIAEYPPRGPGHTLPELIGRIKSGPDVVDIDEPAPVEPDKPANEQFATLAAAGHPRRTIPRWWWLAVTAVVVTAAVVVLIVVLTNQSAKKTYPSPVLANGSVVEYSDNPLGTHTYRDAKGDNAPAGLGLIPYGYKVVVEIGRAHV